MMKCSRIVLPVLALLLTSTIALGQEPMLRVGDWLEAEEWHNWIGGPDGSSPVRAYVPSEPSNPALLTEFQFSLDGVLWQPFAVDSSGYEPPLATSAPIFPPGDGWSAEFDHALLPPAIPQPVFFRSITQYAFGPPLMIETMRFYDPFAPSWCELDINDWDVVETEIVSMTLDGVGIVDIAEVIVHKEAKQDTFDKGVPGIEQRKHSDEHCAPTSAAQCLKYFEDKGDTIVTGGLGDSTLVDSLGKAMKTSAVSGTDPEDWVSGVTKWIKDHGDDYTVRHIKHEDKDGNSNWTDKNWKKMRDELERCQDVLTAVYWDGGGGHAMTFNSVINDTTADGKIKIDFKDPWTGETEWGELDPKTGEIDNMTGAGGGGGAEIGHTVIICPKEEDPADGGPGLPDYHGPNPYPNPIDILLPYPGRWWIHVTAVNTVFNSHRFIRIIEYAPTSYVPRSPGEHPEVFYLNQNTPNPFTRETSIGFAVAEPARVRMDVYDVSGRLIDTVLDRDFEAGFHTVEWSGADKHGRRVAPGIYYARMQAGGFQQTRKLMLIK